MQPVIWRFGFIDACIDNSSESCRSQDLHGGNGWMFLHDQSNMKRAQQLGLGIFVEFQQMDIGDSLKQRLACGALGSNCEPSQVFTEKNRMFDGGFIQQLSQSRGLCL